MDMVQSAPRDSRMSDKSAMRRHQDRQDAAATKSRPIHHSPWFWLGVAMFMTAILTYVFSEDLSLRPRLHGAGRTLDAKPLMVP
jgi:hypothetical protein